ncbi:hypothetical protein GOV03_03590 [Candidatus Woesearchaeota archaeon]|nr:hypothetical protein [Candidatus Woesearchaeota archaeon]
MSSKGQGRTFWIVVTAVVALVVLVVLLLIFTGKTGMLNEGLTSCEGKGVCRPCATWDNPSTCADACGEGRTLSTIFTCPDEKVCCLET